MERWRGLCLTGAVLALGIATLSAAAQNKTTTQTTTTTTTVTQNRINSLRTDMRWDPTVPASPAQDKIMLLQLMADKNFTKRDIVKVLPLLEDLRDAENLYMYGMDATADNWAMMHDQTRYNGTDAVRNETQKFISRRDSIWSAITADIGADKAAVLRPLVEPVREDISTYTYTDSHLERIDQLLRDWDRLAAARIAANPPSGNATASTVSVETTTTTTTAVIPGIEVYTFPMLTTQDLVDVMEMRLAALEGMGDPAAVIAVRGNELTSPNVRFLREHRMKYWD